MDPKRNPRPTTTLSRTGSGTGSIILGKYQLGRVLGRGSFAKVYEATALATGATVAIKAIDKPDTVDIAVEERLIREVSAMRRLNRHPNILKLHEVMATKTKIYLVMDLAAGGELFAKLKLSRNRRFTENTARRYFQQLVSTLSFCHKYGIAHRDVKPQNLLLDHDGNLKVADFGLSALPEQLKNGLLHTACGTPAYTAPEVVYRKGYDGAKADAWSCGVILFVFLAGSLPFDDSNLPNMYRKIHRREFQFPEWLSKPARVTIYRLLDPNPSTRMSIAGLMEQGWFKKGLVSEPKMELVEGGDSKCDFVASINAFDIISMSPGLDLSGLFEAGVGRRERRFTARERAEAVEERVVEVGGKLGYEVRRGKVGVIGLAKGRTVVAVGVFEVAAEVVVVELKVVDGVVEFEEVEWEDLRVGLGDVAVLWQDVATVAAS
ncbi:hypothetical protein RJ639_002079 [Escallonia herrerae]|uniref:non-specific serine/threonine protein kinase n=1 Tax=Escallonia herrerae TaxID=1293975 RepID=A0AA89BIE0_9ASTE|nr:hypothetical protein RJ639_002079 [Escallonia herrerae]